MPEYDNPARVEEALAEIHGLSKSDLERQYAIERLSAARALGPRAAVCPTTPYSEATLALWRVNITRRDDFTCNPRMISLQEMPSDEIVQGYLREALLARSVVYFEVSGRLLSLE
jgi:hypothetical protein